MGIALFAAMMVAMVGAHEGLRTTTYKDIVGIPTVCYGETRGVKMGDTYTKTQCDAQLKARLAEFETGLQRIIPGHASIPDKTWGSYISLSYNIGLGAFEKSSVARYANAGRLADSCEAIMLYNKARVNGGPLRPVKGLTIRRAEERKLCLEGLGH